MLASGAVVVAGYAWWAVALPPFSASATAAVLVAGGAAVLVGASRPRREWPAVDRRRTVPWVLLGTLGALWQLAAYLQHPRDDHPTVSSLMNALLDSRPARAAALLLWLAVTVALSRR